MKDWIRRLVGNPRRRVIDSFTYFNERELCELRMRLLDDVVDYFVVVEANVTHRGEAKPFNFHAVRETLPPGLRRKVVYHPMRLKLKGLRLDCIPDSWDKTADHWKLENFQRNGIDRACRRFRKNDVLVISDVDEIPDPRVLHDFIEDPEALSSSAIALEQHFFYYSLANLRTERWRGSVVTTVGRSRAQSAQWHRDSRCDLPHRPVAGWHLSYFGGPARIRQKIEAFAHQEFNVERIKSESNIAARLADGGDLFGRDIEVTRVDEAFFPADFLKAAAPLRDFLW